MSKADEIKEEACSINYESEYKRLKEENLYIRQENEKKLQANQQMWQQIVDEKEKEIDWLKSVINRILHI